MHGIHRLAHQIPNQQARWQRPRPEPELAENEQLINVMMQGMDKVMDHKPQRFETWTETKFDSLQAQIDVAAPSTNKGMTELRKDADETKQHMQELNASFTTMHQTMTEQIRAADFAKL